MDDEQKRKIARQSWQRGNDSLGKEDFKFAVEMYRQAVNLCPDNVLFRQTLRATEYKMYDNNKKGAGGLFTKGKFTKLRTQCKTARMRSHWVELDKAAEDGLFLNPWDAGFNSDAGEACYQRGYLEVATELFRLAVGADPNNADHLRALATVQEERGNFIEAGKLWDKIYKLDPMDGDARRRAQECITKATMKDGYDDAESTQDVKADKPKNAYDEGRPAISKGAREDKDELSEEEQLQRAVRKNPEGVEERMKLGEYYRKQKNWEPARETYQAALELSGGDHNIREHVEDCEVEILRANHEAARRKARDGDPKLKSTADRVKKELLKREMEVLRSRMERYPNDSKFKYELATRYMLFQNFKEAIPLLQQCVSDKRRQADVLLRLGKCFIGVKNESIAKRQFTKAIEVINPIDDPENFCEAHYVLGRLAEVARDKSAAEGHYNEILSVNYDYKDVQRRLDDLAKDDGDASGST